MLNRYFVLVGLLMFSLQLSSLRAEETKKNTTTHKHKHTHGTHNTVEPQPPQILELVTNDELSSNGLSVIDLKLHQTLNGNMRLNIVGNSSLQFKSKGRNKIYKLRKGKKSMQERIDVNTSNGQHKRVQIKLELLNDKGEVWLTQTKELEFNKPAQETGKARVAVILTQPNGKSIVQYMTRERAAKFPNAKIVEPKAKKEEAK